MYAAQEDRWGMKTLGFLLAPTLVGLTVGAITTKATDKPIDTATAILLGAGTAGILWYGSNKVDDLNLQAFARGGAWGSIVGLALLPVVAAGSPRRLTR